jgi:hypothetical protein
MISSLHYWYRMSGLQAAICVNTIVPEHRPVSIAKQGKAVESSKQPWRFLPAPFFVCADVIGVLQGQANIIQPV